MRRQVEKSRNEVEASSANLKREEASLMSAARAGHPGTDIWSSPPGYIVVNYVREAEKHEKLVKAHNELVNQYNQLVRSQQGGSQWATQDRNSNATVRVSGGYDRRTHGDFSPDSQRTDIEVFDKTAGNGVEKTHISIDTEGNKTVWHGNESLGE